MAKAKGHDRLTPEGERFLKQMAELASKQVRVGFQQGEATTESGVDVVDIAAFNELGTATAPARPFMRNSVDNHLDAIGNMGAAQLQNIVKGGTAEQALNVMGEMQVGLIKTRSATPPDGQNPTHRIRSPKRDQPFHSLTAVKWRRVCITLLCRKAHRISAYLCQKQRRTTRALFAL